MYELSKINKIGFLIDNIPLAYEAVQFAEINGINPIELAFYGGEEYELVITLKPELLEKTQKNIEKNGGCLIPIGKVIKEQKIIIDFKGKKESIEPRGWEHFKN